MKITKNTGILSSVALLALAAVAQGQTIMYVDADATGPAHDGSSWCDAYLTLSEALGVVTSGTTIRVAGGTYTPDPTGLADPREATFQMVNGVTLEGGYAGCGAPDPDERDITAHETILSGDLNGDDGPFFANNDENVYHVTIGSGTDASAILDGFTITAGNADGELPLWQHVGAGMFNDGGSPTVIDCMFVLNNGNLGVAMHNRNGSNPVLIRCTLAESFPAGPGAADAMANQQNSNPTLIDCTFSENPGGGMRNFRSSPKLIGCTFRNNDRFGGGAAVQNSGASGISSHPVFINCELNLCLTQAVKFGIC